MAKVSCNDCKHVEFCYHCINNKYFEPEKKEETKSDNVNHPAHYQGNRECIDVMLDMFGVEAVKSFCRCNSFKYRFRADKKNGAEDIKKAEWYENKLHELESMKNENC